MRSNPQFPLNDLSRLCLGRLAVLGRRRADPRWRVHLDKVEQNTKLPWFVRLEARRFRLLGRARKGEEGDRSRLRNTLRRDRRGDALTSTALGTLEVEQRRLS